MSAMLVMPETHLAHVVTVNAYVGKFNRFNGFVIPRISIDMHFMQVMQRNTWAWKEVHGVRELKRNYHKAELICTIEELPQMASEVFSFLQSRDAKQVPESLPFGAMWNSDWSSSWTPAATALDEQHSAERRRGS
jgi:hypothetical protein